jgi:erythronate-4-phosphate dehydrogenase
MDIWIDENIPLGLGIFGPHGKVTTFAGRALKRADIAAADALIVRSVTRVDENLLAGTRVRFVATATIGTDHVDLPWLAERGIGFASAPGSNANSVGDYVAAAMIRLERLGRWSPQGRTLGIVGYGNVGRRVAAKAEALGMRVVKCDPPLKAAAADPGEFLDLEPLLAMSDAVSLHVPLVSSGPHPTLRLADRRFFSRLTRPILFLNTCRGDAVVEADLLAARAAGKVAAMVLDVFAGEPRIDRALCDAADIVTPHIAGYSAEGKVGGTFQVAEAFRKFFSLPLPALPPWPVPAEPVLAWPDMADDDAFLAACVQAAYDIAADDAGLRAALGTPDPGAAFDRLRKQYPVRHEYHRYQVTGLPSGKRDLQSRLQGLGFQVR